MKITLPNGVTIEGTPEQVSDVGKKMGFDLQGDERYYWSISKGPILITEMETTHLKNAVLKIYREWVAGLSSLEPAQIYRKIANGIDDKIWLAMVRELRSR